MFGERRLDAIINDGRVASHFIHGLWGPALRANDKVVMVLQLAIPRRRVFEEECGREYAGHAESRFVAEVRGIRRAIHDHAENHNEGAVANRSCRPATAMPNARRSKLRQSYGQTIGKCVVDPVIRIVGIEFTYQGDETPRTIRAGRSPRTGCEYEQRITVAGKKATLGLQAWTN
jgi:hypothetical protein